MEQPQVLNTLSEKKREIEAHIGSLERDLEQARRDLSAVLATIKVFSGEGPLPTAYMNLSKVFPRHEPCPGSVALPRQGKLTDYIIMYHLPARL